MFTTVNVLLRAMPCLAGKPIENSFSFVAAIQAYEDRSPNLLATISDFPSYGLDVVILFIAREI